MEVIFSSIIQMNFHVAAHTPGCKTTSRNTQEKITKTENMHESIFLCGHRRKFIMSVYINSLTNFTINKRFRLSKLLESNHQNKKKCHYKSLEQVNRMTKCLNNSSDIYIRLEGIWTTQFSSVHQTCMKFFFPLCSAFPRNIFPCKFLGIQRNYRNKGLGLKSQV